MPEFLSLTDGLGAVLRAVSAATEPITVLIDGPSGSGKSTFTDLVVAGWPSVLEAPQLLRLDDVYPGWSGLEAASRALATDVLAPRVDGRDGRWQRWDWARDHGAEWHVVPSARSLVVEGCGTLSKASAAFTDVRVWIEADGVVRKERALARDGGAFDDHWDDWDEQWMRFASREHPSVRADLLVDGG